MTDKYLSFLGLCRKANKMSLGFNNTADSVKARKAVLIIIASDLSEKTEKELRYITRDTLIDVVRTRYDIKTLSSAIGLKAGVIAVEDNGFATALKEKYKGENQYDD